MNDIYYVLIKYEHSEMLRYEGNQIDMSAMFNDIYNAKTQGKEILLFVFNGQNMFVSPQKIIHSEFRKK